jgi:hypothetical protein
MEASRDKKMDDMALHETKAEIFDTWTVINRAFEQIISGLEKLQKMGVLSDDYEQARTRSLTICGQRSIPRSSRK